MSVELREQLKRTKRALRPTAQVYDGLCEMYELMKLVYHYMEKNMDKQINKVKKDVVKGDKKKAKKDIGKLLKMDKKFDKKLDECKDMKTKKKGK